jgi:hypothetical protein
MRIHIHFRITTLGAAIKVDQEGLPNFQEVSDLAIAHLVGITVSRDMDAVDAFRASAASIQRRTTRVVETSVQVLGELKRSARVERLEMVETSRRRLWSEDEKLRAYRHRVRLRRRRGDMAFRVRCCCDGGIVSVRAAEFHRTTNRLRGGEGGPGAWCGA